MLTRAPCWVSYLPQVRSWLWLSNIGPSPAFCCLPACCCLSKPGDFGARRCWWCLESPVMLRCQQPVKPDGLPAAHRCVSQLSSFALNAATHKKL